MSATETITRQATRTGTDILTSRPHICARCRRETYWFRNQGGRSFCIRCANRETAEHDPFACGEGKDCAWCAVFWTNEQTNRKIREKKGE